MKRILVTGGSRGLGLAICRGLLQDQLQVVTASRRMSPELEELIGLYPKRLEWHPADFADAAAPGALCKAARLLDGLDGFVANAAIGTEGLLTLSSESALRECMQVNLIAPMLLAREAVKAMLPKGGSLVFIASVAARTAFSGLSAYSAAKGGIVSFSRVLAREYGEKGIRSNAVLPGFLTTEMSAAIQPDARARLTRRTALKRLGTVEEVVEVVTFLLSDKARYITGTEVVIDGGLTA